MIFSHGIGFDRIVYSGILAELASYGLMVIALNHNDQSCTYTMGPEQEVQIERPPESESGPQTIRIETVRQRERLEFDTDHMFDDMEFRKIQLQIRESEI